MTTNVERLKAKLAENGLRIGGVSWNESFKGDPEERAAALLSVIENLEAGDFEIVDGFDD
jgi:hypothetical protein